jgi:serine/threonine-protein kinase SRPK3
LEALIFSIRQSDRSPPLSEYTVLANIAHALDICPEHVAFTSTGLADTSQEELFEVLGDPFVERLVRLDGQPLHTGLPSQLVEDASWETWIDEDEEAIRLLSFGSCFRHGREPDVPTQGYGYEVPEVIFGDKWDCRVDLWRLGCTVCESWYLDAHV